MVEYQRHKLGGTVGVGFQDGHILAGEDYATRGAVHSESSLQSDSFARKNVADRTEVLLHSTQAADSRSIFELQSYHLCQFIS